MNKQTILLVDDDILVLKLVNRMLTNKELKVLKATDGKEALKVLEKQEKVI